MRKNKYIFLLIVALHVACNTPNKPIPPVEAIVDSVYTEADFRYYGDYYGSGHQVFAIDMLSEGLDYDSVYHITGTGYNLFLSDIFVAGKDSVLPAGHYVMDSVANDRTFLRGMQFDGNITGCYLLKIVENQIQQILLFHTGDMIIDYVGDNVVVKLNLCTEKLQSYHFSFEGSTNYR